MASPPNKTRTPLTPQDLWVGNTLAGPDSSTLPVNGHHATIQAIDHLRSGVTEGRPWEDVLLEAVGLWTAREERYKSRDYVYLIQGEAFDWLLLVERLLREVPKAVPEVERERLLFRDEMPDSVSGSRFREALGEEKYQAHLNFFYGVVVEEALMLAVEGEVMKQRGVRGLHHVHGVDDLVMVRLYGDTTGVLLRRYYREMGRRFRGSLTLSDWKSFTYWLFKRRLARSDQSRIASDTRKGLRQLHTLRPLGGVEMAVSMLSAF